jgi:hypothetical protein
MYKKNIKPFFPTGSRNIILIVMVIGVGALFYGINKDATITLLGAIIFLISVFVITGYYGVEVDFDKKTYRNYLSFIFLLKFGKWKILPETKEIALMPLKHFMSKHALRGNLYTEIFQIKLLGEDPNESVTISRGLYGQLVLEAEELSKKLNVPFKEYL